MRPEQKKAKDAQVLKEWARFKINRTLLRQAVTRELSQSLGVKPHKDSHREDIYEVPIGPWMLRTLVDFGGGKLGGFQLRYFQGIRHTVLGESLTGDPLLAVNSMSWLGPGVPHWNLLTNANLDEAATVLTILCTRFVQASCSMLRALDAM